MTVIVNFIFLTYKIYQCWIIFELRNSTFDYSAWYCLSVSIFWWNSTDVCAFFHERIRKIPKLKQHSGLGRQCSEAVSSHITLQLSLSSETLSISHPIYLVTKLHQLAKLYQFQSCLTHNGNNKIELLQAPLIQYKSCMSLLFEVRNTTCSS